MEIKEESRFIVMERLGETLNNFREPYKTRDVLNMGIQMINFIEKLHHLGICHQDIKPDNIMIGRFNGHDMQTGQIQLSNLNEVFFIDMGRSKPFIDPLTGEQIQNKKNQKFEGNFIFGSIHQINGDSFSRRDDII